MELLGWLNAGSPLVTQPDNDDNPEPASLLSCSPPLARRPPSIDDCDDDNEKKEEEESKPAANFVCKSASHFEQKR